MDIEAPLAHTEASSELILRKVSLRSGQRLPLHAHGHTETLFLLEGTARLQRGRAVAQLEAPGAAYFPAGTYHGVAAAADGACSFLVCYPRSDPASAIETTLSQPDVDQSTWPNPNLISGTNPLFRWAVAEDYEPAVGVEPTKGVAVTARYLFGPERGAPDVLAGTCRQLPRVHYSMHRHQPAEIYYVLEGDGIVRIGSEPHAVTVGSALYVPSGVSHGIDTHEHPLHYFWIYSLVQCGPAWTWEAVEDIYNHPKSGSPT